MDDDFTYVATRQGFVYVAFIVDAYARRIAEIARLFDVSPNTVRRA